MKNLPQLFLAFLLSWYTSSLIANNNPVTIWINGVATQAEHRVKGPVNLYVVYRVAEETAGIDNFYRQEYTTEMSPVYYIELEGEFEEIRPLNYKKVIRKYLEKAPYLINHLGKPGFRYENIPYMIEFYNKFRV